MANAFDQLPKDASLDMICGYAGRLFRAKVENDKRTDWKNRKHFNDAMWFLAEDAARRDFYVLLGMRVDEIASAIGSSVSRHINSQPEPFPSQKQIDEWAREMQRDFEDRQRWFERGSSGK